MWGKKISQQNGAVGQYQIIRHMQLASQKKRETEEEIGKEEIFEEIMARKFQINNQYQATNPRILENTKQNKHLKTYPDIS